MAVQDILIMSDLCVVHLVRAKNTIEPFAHFLQSYKDNRGGMEHDLLFVFKGFHGDECPPEYDDALRGFPHRKFFVNDFGFDIRAYFSVARAYNYKFFCFLNSFSTLLDRDWLVKLYSHLSRKNIGLVSATGSYESPYSNILREQQHDERINGSVSRRLRRYLARTAYRFAYDPYPNYHVRTNGFMISRDVMSKIHSGLILTKENAHRFESGRKSLTKQVLRMNLKVLVIGKNGTAYEKEDWCSSGTFRQGEQNNLLIADNQTSAYLHASPDLKSKLARLAWGA